MTAAYRDQFAPERARLVDALARRAKLEARVRARFSEVEKLNVELRRARAPTVKLCKPSSLETALLEAPDVDGLNRDELAAQERSTAESVERAAADARQLGRLVRALRRRLHGEVAAEPLAEPPRKVPASYLLAEWGSRPALILYASATLYSGIGESFESSQARLAVAMLLGVLLVLVVARRLDGSSWIQHVVPLVPAAVGAAAVSVVLEWGLGPGVIVAIVLGAALADGIHVLRLRKFLECYRAAEAHVRSKARQGWSTLSVRAWDVHWALHIREGSRCTLAFVTDDGLERETVVHGTRWEAGVVLHDPNRVLPVHRLLCRPRPDSAGAWSDVLLPVVWLRSLLVPIAFGIALWSLFR